MTQPRSWVAPDEQPDWEAFLDGENIAIEDLYRMSDSEEGALVRRFREEYLD